MASIIKVKRSSTQGSVPSSLELGEIAVNLYDRKIYVGNTTGVTAVGGEQFRLTTQAATSGEGAYLRIFSDTPSFANNVLLNEGEGIDISRQANGSILISGEDASDTNKGVASFDSGDFSVSSGAVTLADSASGAVLAINGTTNEVEVSRTNGTVTVGLPDDVTITGQLNVSENIVVTGNTTVGGTFNVDGATTLNGVTVTTLQANSTLDVSGLASLDGGIDVDGAFTVADTTGNIDTSGTLNVDGLSTLNGVTTTTITANGAVNIDNTTGSTSTTTGALIVDGGVGIAEKLYVGNDVSIAGGLQVDGNLNVEGAVTYISSSTVNVDDSMLKLSANNAADTVDGGIYVKYVDGATTKYAGWFRDASDSGIFKYYKELEVEPTTTVDTGATGYAQGQIDAIIDGGSY